MNSTLLSGDSGTYLVRGKLRTDAELTNLATRPLPSQPYNQKQKRDFLKPCFNERGESISTGRAVSLNQTIVENRMLFGEVFGSQ